MSHTMYSASNWKSYFVDIGIDDTRIDTYISFINRCYEKKIPPIFEVEHLSLLLGVELSELYSMIFGTEHFYRSFKIRKRSGGFREISAPFPSLLSTQKWISENILSKIRVSICAAGFRPNKSILTNARLHCGRDQLIKIDLKDFFPNISFRRIISVFREIGYPENVSFALARLCSLSGKLPQGSAASPSLSNIICRKLDFRLYRMCRSEKLRYTRYADDIVISGQTINDGIKRLSFEIIESEGFKINNQKVRFLYPDDKKIVTGLDITSGSPRVTRSFRRELKKDVYFVWTAGLSSHLGRRRIFSPNYVDHLKGRLRFWESVEPGCPQMLICKGRLVQISKLYQNLSAHQFKRE